MELREIVTQDRYTILNERKSGDNASMTILAPWTEANVKNQNERIYPLALLQRETARVQELIEKGAFLGTGDHPRKGLATVADTSHLVKKLWLDSGGKGWAELKIFPTTKGKNIMEIIRGGGQLGISTRGFGKINDKGVVQDDYKLMGIDIVCAPSFKNATFSAKDIISESLAFEDKKEGQMKKDLDEDFLRLVYQETGETEERIEKLLKQLETKKYLAADVRWEALAAGCDPQVYADKLNEQIARKNADNEFPFTIEITENILKEAAQCGVNIAIPEERQEYLKIYQKQRQETEAAEARQLEEAVNLTAEQLAEIEKKKKEKIREMKISSLIKESMLAGGSPEKIRQIVKESLKEV